MFSCLLLFCFPGQIRAQTPPASAQNTDRVVQLLKEITEAPGPPGYEEPVRKIMTERMRAFTDKISYDGLGSVIAQQGDAGPRIMLDAHMDELGGMVRHIRPDGFISMEMLGYWLDAALPDQRWVILGSKGPVLAVTDIWDAHIAPHDAQGQRGTPLTLRPLAFRPAIPSRPSPTSRSWPTIATSRRLGTTALAAPLCSK